MGKSPKRGAAAWTCASLAGALLCGVSTQALAEPAAKTSAAAQAAAANTARMESMQRQLDDLRGQLDSLRASGSSDPRIGAIQTQLDAMARDLADLKTAQAADASNIATIQSPQGGTTTATLPNGKPALATADGRFTANLRAIIMFDAGNYFQKNNLSPAVVGRDLNEGTNFRRARFGIDGKLFRDIDYAIIYEFGGSGAEDAGHIQEIWAQYTALKPFRIRIGAFEPNIGLAAAVSTSQMPLMERPSPAEVARNVAAGDSRSAIQVAGNGVWGSGDSGIAARWFVSSAITGNTVGTINSTGGSTSQPFGEQWAWIGRFAVAPFSSTTWQTHFGVNYQYVFQPNDATGAGGANPRYPVQLRDRPELRLDGTRLVDTGAIDADHVEVLGLEGGATVANFMLDGEWFKYKINRRITGAPLPNPDFDGWYVEGVWVLTGESRPYNPAEARFDAPKMNYNFNPEAGTWGAFELAARYSDLNLNYNEGAFATATPVGGVRGGEQKILGVGLNWYWNPDIRFMLNYQHVKVDRLNAAGAQIGQTYDSLALRSQLTF